MSNVRWLEFFQKSLDASDVDGLLRRRRWHVDISSVEFQESGGRKLVNFGTNDYLGLRHEPALRNRAAQAMQVSGVGAGASPLVSGYNLALAELENQIARWQHSQSALVFSSGLAMNIGIVSALPGPNDLLLSDRLNHASLIDGCRLSAAHKRIYDHADVGAVEQLLKEQRHKYERALLVTESVFSMDGDVAPLEDLTRLCSQYDVGMLVDEAHATGLFGATGAGYGEQLQLSDQWLLKLGTLSKGLGGCGGYVTGQRSAIDFLVNRCRSYIYSTAIAPPVVAAVSAAVEMMPCLHERRGRVIHLSRTVRSRLQAAGWKVPDGDTPIVPVIVGESQTAVALAEHLRERGCYVPAIRPPTVPPGTARLRISLSAAHTEAHLEQLLSAMQQADRS